MNVGHKLNALHIGNRYIFISWLKRLSGPLNLRLIQINCRSNTLATRTSACDNHLRFTISVRLYATRRYKLQHLCKLARILIYRKSDAIFCFRTIGKKGKKSCSLLTGVKSPLTGHRNVQIPFVSFKSQVEEIILEH